MTWFKPRDPVAHAQANNGSGVSDYCYYCGNPFMQHYNGKCPEIKDSEIDETETA